MNPIDPKDFQQRIERIESLIAAIEQSPDSATRANAQELVQAVLDLHGAGLARLLETLAGAGESWPPLIESAARDDLVGNLLLLHGLHPLDLETRVQQALDTVRPYLKSHGGEVELLGVADGVVRLRMEGSCHGCPSSAITLKTSIEEAIIKAAPDTVRIEVEGAAEAPAVPAGGVISVEQLLAQNSAARAEREGPAILGAPR